MGGDLSGWNETSAIGQTHQHSITFRSSFSGVSIPSFPSHLLAISDGKIGKALISIHFNHLEISLGSADLKLRAVVELHGDLEFLCDQLAPNVTLFDAEG